MKIMPAEEAYHIMENVQRIDSFTIHFNNIIRTKAAENKAACSISWEELETTTEEILDEPTLIDQFIGSILDSGYDIEYFYKHREDYAPDGIVVGWGNNREAEMDEIFLLHDYCKEG